MVKASKVKKDNQLKRIINKVSNTFDYLINKISSVSVNNPLNSSKYFKTNNEITESQKNELYEYVLYKNVTMLDLYPFNDDAPLVSLIIINRNSYKHLKHLLENIAINIKYPSYEIIVVDNASEDESLSFLEQVSGNLPLKIIINSENRSFSKSNNQAATIAKGEYLLLLSNSVEPTYGWLNEMMLTTLRYDNSGAVGANLIFPDYSSNSYNKNNYSIMQHTGISFREVKGFIEPYNLWSTQSFENDNCTEEFRAAVTSTALLVHKDKYFQVNGLDEGLIDGYVDLDFCLKLLLKGYINIYCPKALLFNNEFGTQEKIKNREVRNSRFNNRKIFRKKWDKWLRKQLLVDKLNSSFLYSEKPLKIAFAVSENGENASAGDYFTALEFGEALQKIGWKIQFLPRNGPGNWYEVLEDVDVLISLLDDYDPRKIKTSNKSLIKIAWLRNWFERWAAHPGFREYNITFASSKTACDYIFEKTGQSPYLLPIATNPTRFNDNIPQKKEYLSDYCFTGSYWNDPREITEMLDPGSMSYEFKLYGKNWGNFYKFKNYYQGFLNYHKLPEVYASTKIVIDDANRVTKNYGSVNSRVYDAIASGALVITNGEAGAKETFQGKLPVFKSKKELYQLINYYLSNEDARISKVEELQKFILENHTYQNRTQKLKEVLEQYILKI